MCSSETSIKILSEVYDACSRSFETAIQDAYLYGSYARGDYHEESDVDILLTVDIVPEELPRYRAVTFEVSGELSLKYGVVVSITIKPLRQFRRYGQVLPYYQNIIKEGVRYAG